MPRQDNAPCECYDRDLRCFHTIKERTRVLSDATSQDKRDTRPDYMKYFQVNPRQYRSTIGRVKTA